MVAFYVGDAGTGIARSSAGIADPRQRQGRVVRLAHRSEDRGDLFGLAGRSGPVGADTAGTRLPTGGVRVRAVHSIRSLYAARCLEPEAVGSAERAGAGILECEEELISTSPRDDTALAQCHGAI